jgi:5-(aminomethyl)-3-furanmethanol phosphate kinase
MKPLVVVKVGGSLLDWPDLPDRFSSCLEDRRADRLVVIVGGGRIADVLRDLDACHSLGEARSHALALNVLDITARVFAELVPGLEVVEALDYLPDAWSRGMVPVLAPRRFLEADDRSPDPLPHAWTTTSDAIAARVADRLGAGELILLKSTPLPPGCDRAEAARLGLVDPEFPRVSQGVPVVTYLNLRDPNPRAGLALPMPIDAGRQGEFSSTGTGLRPS